MGRAHAEVASSPSFRDLQVDLSHSGTFEHEDKAEGLDHSRPTG